jgi:Fe-S cluster biosynthesis and repair protein YggX
MWDRWMIDDLMMIDDDRTSVYMAYSTRKKLEEGLYAYEIPTFIFCGKKKIMNGAFDIEKAKQ